jgi:hypothetical protein
VTDIVTALSLHAPQQCVGLTRSGRQCQNRLNVSPESGLCVAHDPARAAEVLAIRQKGAKASNAKRSTARIPPAKDAPQMPESLEDIARVQAWVAHQTYTGGMDARTSEATTKALRNQQLILEKRDLERRLKDLLRVVSDLKKCPSCAAKWNAAASEA